MRVHELKVKQPFYDDLYFQKKSFEVRLNDRNYKKGDILHLKEFPKENFEKQTGLFREVIYILEGGEYGIEKEYVILGLKKVEIK